MKGIRRVKTRGGSARRGGGVIDARSGRVRNRGRGSQEPVILQGLEELPEQEPLEVALNQNRRRKRPILLNEAEDEVPLPVLYVEVGGRITSPPSASGILTSVKGDRTSSPPPRTRRRLETKMAARSRAKSRADYDLVQQPHTDGELVNRGSDAEEEIADEDGEALPVFVPRAARQLLIDESDDDEQTSAVAALLRFEQAASLPLSSSADPDAPTALVHRPVGFLDFDWRSMPERPAPASERRETFTLLAGPTTSACDPYELFKLIWDTDVIDRIVLETNRYARQTMDNLVSKGTLSTNSRLCKWRDTDVDEMYTFIALNIAMGINVKNRVPEYWSKDQNIFISPGYRAYMSLKRFQALSRCSHFNNNLNLPEACTPSEARLHKIQPILSHLNSKFQSLYVCSQNIALEESQLHQRKCLDKAQGVPSKRAAARIRSYEVCDTKTGYLWRFDIRTASSSASLVNPLADGVSEIIFDLLKGLEHCGYTVWMDNFYNGPALARKLKSLGFDCVGNLRATGRFVPFEVKSLKEAEMRRGQVVSVTSGDVDLVVWSDKNRVAMLSTYHGNGVTVVYGTKKPTVVQDYNICMGGVDKKDQMLAAYPLERKRSRVWYKKLFRRFLNVSVLNAYIIHRHNAVDKLTHFDFRQELVKSILNKHFKSPVNIDSSLVPSTSNTGPLNPYPAMYHYPGDYPFLSQSKKSRMRKHCKVCHKRSSMYCVGCNICVCDRLCFSQLHKL